MIPKTGFLYNRRVEIDQFARSCGQASMLPSGALIKVPKIKKPLLGHCVLEEVSGTTPQGHLSSMTIQHKDFV